MYRLMIKTHNITGLKYLCMTIREDYKNYKGSGVYWKRHLRKHGDNITTEVIFESDNRQEFEQYCSKKSIEFNIVESNEWANLVPEDGNTIKKKYFRHTEETKAKMSKSRMGHPTSEETKRKISLKNKGKHGKENFNYSKEASKNRSNGQKNRNHTEEEINQIRQLGINNKGKKTSPDVIQKIQKSKKGYKASEETKRKQSESMKLFYENRFREFRYKRSPEEIEKFSKPQRKRKKSAAICEKIKDGVHKSKLKKLINNALINEYSC